MFIYVNVMGLISGYPLMSLALCGQVHEYTGAVFIVCHEVGTNFIFKDKNANFLIIFLIILNRTV